MGQSDARALGAGDFTDALDSAWDALSSALSSGRGLVAVAVVLLIVLGAWRVLARHVSNESHAGAATLALAVTALAAAVAATAWTGLSPAVAWGAAGVVLAAAALASSEWLRSSLRTFAVLAAVVLSAVLVRLGVDAAETKTVADAATTATAAAAAEAAGRCAELRTLSRTAATLRPARAELVVAATALTEARAALDDVLNPEPDPGQDPGPAAGPAAVGPEIRAPALEVLAEAAAGVRDATTADRLDSAAAALDQSFDPTTASAAEVAVVAAADTVTTAAGRVTDLASTNPASEIERLTTGCGSGTATSSTSTATPVEEVTVLQARVYLADYRNTISPWEVTAAAAETARTDLEAAQAAEEGASDPDKSGVTAWVDLAASGATIAATTALSVLPGDPGPGAWFWVVVGLVLLYFWWLIERRSASMVAGPVKVTFEGAEPPPAADTETPSGQPGEPGEPGVAAQQAVFVTALTKNLREPGSTPDSTATSPLTDLESVVTAAAPGKVLAAAITALKSLLNTPRGSRVFAQVIAPLPNDSRWRIFVVVTDAATGATLASKEHAGTSAAVVCRLAGYWAAATVLSASPRLPTWARWSPATAVSFAASDDAADPTAEALASALRQAPASNLVLRKLGDTRALDGDYLAAAQLYARAVVVDPTDRFTTYRLAAALATLGRPPTTATATATGTATGTDKGGGGGEDRVPAALVALLNTISGTHHRTGRLARMRHRLAKLLRSRREFTVPTKPFRAGMDTDEAAEEFLTLARLLFWHLRRTQSIRRVLIRALRRDQRDSIGSLFGVFGKYGPRARARAALEIAALAALAAKPDKPGKGRLGNGRRKLAEWFASRKHAKRLSRVATYAHDPRSGWQVPYNLACYYSLSVVSPRTTDTTAASDPAPSRTQDPHLPPASSQDPAPAPGVTAASVATDDETEDPEPTEPINTADTADTAGSDQVSQYPATARSLWWLQVALTRPGVENLAGAWLDRDPDLHQVRTGPETETETRFAELQEWARPAEKDPPTGSPTPAPAQPAGPARPASRFKRVLEALRGES